MLVLNYLLDITKSNPNLAAIECGEVIFELLIQELKQIAVIPREDKVEDEQVLIRDVPVSEDSKLPVNEICLVYYRRKKMNLKFLTQDCVN